MNEVMTPRGVDPEKILEIAIDMKVPAIMSYLSRDKWHVAKVQLIKLDGDNLSIESTISKKQRPINIRVDQPVGISFKHGYGKFVFDTTVKELEPSTDPETRRQRGGTIVLKVPDKIEVIQRRSYFRVSVPESLNVKVLLWHRSGKRGAKELKHDVAVEMQNCCQGRLMDISAGGAQVIVPNQNDAGKADFKKGQFISMRFTPLPYETPLVLSAQIRNVLPTADDHNSSLGLQIVGLEASSEGREILNRLIGIVEKYYQVSQSGAKQHAVHQGPNAD
ncbi:MAG: flagellar brake protein [Planctomycetota bacterium]|jgi:c-di-GMP-binding flagellar brake protein YcgR